jgi:sRNA-binding carbon storage regulator CsrA
MLVLTRRVNEAVVLADELIVTLVRLLPERVELTIQAIAGGPSAFVAVELGKFADVGRGVRVSLVDVQAAALCSGTGCSQPKARLGFELPPTAWVSRKEVWEVSGGRGPRWYSAGDRSQPSQN